MSSQGVRRALELDDSMRTAALTQLGFREAAETWLETRRLYLAPRTFVDYSNYIKTLSNFFSEMRLPEITSDLLRAYQKVRKGSVGGLKINQELGCLSQMLKRIGRWQDLAGDYQPLKINRQSPGRAITDREYERLFRHAMSKPEWEMAYLFAVISVNTTAGPKEVWTLRIQDFDRDARLIKIQPEGAKNPHRCRLIPLNDQAFAALDRVVELAKKRGACERDHYLFPYRIHGNAYGGIYDPTRHCTTCKTAWKKLTIAANLPGLRPYDLRHTAITSILQNPEVSEETAKSIAGHISDNILKTYSHIRIDAKRAALDALVKKSTTI